MSRPFVSVLVILCAAACGSGAPRSGPVAPPEPAQRGLPCGALTCSKPTPACFVELDGPAQCVASAAGRSGGDTYECRGSGDCGGDQICVGSAAGNQGTQCNAPEFWFGEGLWSSSSMACSSDRECAELFPQTGIEVIRHWVHCATAPMSPPWLALKFCFSGPIGE